MDELQELQEAFYEEAREFLNKFSDSLQEWEAQPENHEILDIIFREIHSIKGAAGFMGYMNWAKLAHALEDVLSLLQKNFLKPDAHFFLVFNDAFDVFTQMIQEIKKNQTDALDTTNILHEIEQVKTQISSQINEEEQPAGAINPSSKTIADSSTAEETDQPGAINFLDEFSDPEEIQQIIESFVLETRELLDGLNNDLITLEKNPQNKELIHKIFRIFHTIKGTSAFVNFTELSQLTHSIEDLLNKVRQDEIQFSPIINDILLHSVDVINEMLEKFTHQESIGEKWLQIVQNIEGFLKNAESPSEKKSGMSTFDANPSDRLKALMDDTTVRVDVRRLDKLLNLIGELVLIRNRLRQVMDDAVLPSLPEHVKEEVQGTSQKLDFLISEIQNAVMTTRMLPISRVFNKIPRLVRDLSRQANKEVELIIEGESTEVDKSVIEIIGDPLVHILRNSLDHGIEPPDERIKKGKPSRGTIHIKAYQQGSYIVIECRDDGRGIDVEKVVAKAVEKKIISQKQAEEMSRKELLNLIFMPGFSTAARVTSISGRGVGLDVVKTNVARLNGRIEVESTPDQGTTFYLYLPLTMAIIQGLLVQVADEIFVIPITSVIETFRADQFPLRSIQKHPHILYRDQILPLVFLEKFYSLNGNGRPFSHRYIVLVGYGEKKIGIVIDRLQGQKEVVIKPLGEFLQSMADFSGATILGDGRVCLILDIGRLVQSVDHAEKDWVEA